MKKENVIYMSNECIQLIIGCDDHKDMIKIYNYKSYPFLEGTIINGVITDDYEIKNTLKQVANDGYQEVNLVIDSSQILSKSISIPRLNKDEIYKVIADELSSISENSEELVYDYAYLGPSLDGKGANQILCCAVERKLITSYLDVFAECGMKVKAIDFSINILCKLVKEMVTRNHLSYLISMVDGNNLTSVLFENNCYKLSYRSRIVSARDSIMFEQEVLSNLSNIYQFSKSGENSVSLEAIYFSGLHEEELGLLNRISQNIPVNAEVLEKPTSIYVVNNKENFHLDQYILPIGFLLKK